MFDVEQGSLDYFLGRPVEPRWAGFLTVLAEELAAQMPATELRSFFGVLGRRWAQKYPLPASGDLKQLEASINSAFSACEWGWVYVRDLGNCIEFLHSCAPLRTAFGANALEWTPGFLEGLYEQWLQDHGAGKGLVLKQAGRVQGPADTLRLRLATADYFA